MNIQLDVYPTTKRSQTPVSGSSRLRNAQSCYSLPNGVGYHRYSLPSSPRLPPLPVRAYTTMQGDSYLVPDSAVTMKFAHTHKTTSSLDVPALDPRGRARTDSYSSSRATSPTPSIILTPPQAEPESRRESLISLLSSSSAGYSPDAPSSYDAASESESVWSEASSGGVRPPTIRDLVLETFRDNYREELRVPVQPVSLVAQEVAKELYVSNISLPIIHHLNNFLQQKSTFLTIKTSEFLPSPLLFRPGAHGYLVPSSWALYEMLRHQAEHNHAGCHVFATQGDGNAKYHGYYRVVQRDIPLAQWEWLRMPKKVSLTSMRRRMFSLRPGCRCVLPLFSRVVVVQEERCLLKRLAKRSAD